MKHGVVFVGVDNDYYDSPSSSVSVYKWTLEADLFPTFSGLTQSQKCLFQSLADRRIRFIKN